MKEAPVEKTDVVVGGQTIHLDPENLRFDESTLSHYLDHEFGWIDYFGKKLEEAQKESLIASMEYERLFAEKYIAAKDNGGTEKYANYVAVSNLDVLNAQKTLIDKKHTVGLIKSHLKAWDKNHENAQNRGHTLRKEMDKLHNTIRQNEETESYEDYLERQKQNG